MVVQTGFTPPKHFFQNALEHHIGSIDTTPVNEGCRISVFLKLWNFLNLSESYFCRELLDIALDILI